MNCAVTNSSSPDVITSDIDNVSGWKCAFSHCGAFREPAIAPVVMVAWTHLVVHFAVFTSIGNPSFASSLPRSFYN